MRAAVAGTPADLDAALDVAIHPPDHDAAPTNSPRPPGWLTSLRAAHADLRVNWGCPVEVLPDLPHLLCGGHLHKLQHACAHVIGDRLLTAALQACPNDDERALLLGAAQPAARAWLSTTANGRDTSFENRDFIFALRLRLGLSLGPHLAQCPRCGQELPRDQRLHALSCNRGTAERSIRHTGVKVALQRALRQVPDLSISNEPRMTGVAPLLRADAALRRADVFLVDHPAARTAVIDVVVHRPSVSGPQSTWATGGAVAAEREKLTTYASRFDLTAVYFVPFALEWSGALGPKGSSFLHLMRRVARDRDKPLSMQDLLAGISVAVQRGNARAVLSMFGTPPSLARSTRASDVLGPPGSGQAR